ncbi:hypothetical protein GCM10011322_35590 [Salinarimonas ramus]|uniref:Uncharacterized protein n=2 Tax=Salinarimonas ramus TaxID=690164 RepID=A0A917QDK3_9HYPH|nr:hypothetical protein GCM10011322_35590 [Salinarimonas ramus]
MGDERKEGSTPPEKHPREEAGERTTQRREDARPEREPPPPAGPHDRPDLVNPDATPGTGALPGRSRRGIDTDPGGG